MAVIGAGAAGAMVAIQLCETAARRPIPCELVLIDPAPEAGRGRAYATSDRRHLLNAPAGNMSCRPDDPGHFVRWLCRHGEPAATPADFSTRHRYGAYLADTLGRAIMAAQGVVTVRRLRARAVGCRWTVRPDGSEIARLELAHGTAVDANRVVLATGPCRADAPWASAALLGSDRFVADPWLPGALDAALVEGRKDDVLLVGTGLTAMDMALLLDRPVHALSRGGRLPWAHPVSPLPAAVCTARLKGLSLPELRTAIRQHIARVTRSHGDWRPAVDGLRAITAELWASLTAEERAEFMERDASSWNVHRHRMPPATAEAVGHMRRIRRLRTYAGLIASVSRRADGSLTVTVSVHDGSERRALTVGWVVDCTGWGRRTSDTTDPLWRSLLDDGAAVHGPLGMGVATEDGRLRNADGNAARPHWTLGAPRLGELWETTAVPEIRVQAEAVAEAVLASWTGPARAADTEPSRRGVRRPVDASGFPLSTHSAAAAAYRTGVEGLLKVRAGARAAFRRAAGLDPGFALAHAALALIGHECGAPVDVPRALADARRCARERADDHERSFVEVVSRRVLGTAAEGDAALVRHLDDYPGDALALAVAVPTIGFSGLHGLDDTAALRLIERTAPAYHGNWFHTSLLAFMFKSRGATTRPAPSRSAPWPPNPPPDTPCTPWPMCTTSAVTTRGAVTGSTDGSRTTAAAPHTVPTSPGTPPCTNWPSRTRRRSGAGGPGSWHRGRYAASGPWWTPAPCCGGPAWATPGRAASPSGRYWTRSPPKPLSTPPPRSSPCTSASPSPPRATRRACGGCTPTP